MKDNEHGWPTVTPSLQRGLAGSIFAALVSFISVVSAASATDAAAIAPKVTIAQAGKPMLPIYFVVNEAFTAQEQATSIEDWRSLVAGMHYKMAYKKINEEEGLLIMRKAQAVLVMDDLMRCLKKMTGADFDLRPVEKFPNDHGPGIYIGTVSDFKWLDLPKDLGYEDFVLKTTRAGQMIITGSQRRGMEHGVYAFLDKLGCRWFFPGLTWEVIPRMKEVTVALDERQGPCFTMRRKFAVSYGLHSKVNEMNFEDWNRRNRMGEPFKVSVTQGWPGFGGNWGTEENKAAFAAHPDWFADSHGDGKRGSGKPCYSHPDVIAIGIKRALDYFENNPSAFMITLSPPDGGNYCVCKSCQELCKKLSGAKEVLPKDSDKEAKFGNMFYGKLPDGTLASVSSDAHFNYVNRVADAVAKKYPGKMVGTLAYAGTAHPPSFDLLPNVYVEVTTGFRWGTPLSFEDQVKAFGKHCQNVGVYEFFNFKTGGDCPPAQPAKQRVSQTRAMKSRLEALHKYHVRGLEGEMSYNWGSEGLGLYTVSRLLWDVKTDPATVSADFFDKAFGSAAEPIRRMYRRWQMGCPYDNKDIMALSYHDLQQALELTVNDPECRARVDQFRMYAHFLKIYIHPERDASQMVEAQSNPEAFREKLASYAEYVQAIMNTGMVHSYPITLDMAKLGEKLGVDDARKWKKVGEIPAVKEVDLRFQEDVAEFSGIDLPTLKDLSFETFTANLVSLKAAQPNLFPAVPPPIDDGQANGGHVLVLAGKGETVRLSLKGMPRNHRQGIHYVVRFSPSEMDESDDEAVAGAGGEATDKPSHEAHAENPKAGKGFRHQDALGKTIKEDTLAGNALNAPDIQFAAPYTGFYRIVWKSANFRTGPVFDISHPSAVLEKNSFAATKLYFFVPRDTKRFFIGITQGSFTIKDGQGKVVLSCTDPVNGKKSNGGSVVPNQADRAEKPAVRKMKKGASDTNPPATVPLQGVAENGTTRISGGGVMVDVPPGSDAAIWSFEGPTSGLIRNIKFIGVSLPSYRSDLLLVPKGALR